MQIYLICTDLLERNMCGIVDGHLGVAIITVDEGYPVWLILLEFRVILPATLELAATHIDNTHLIMSSAVQISTN